MCWMMPLSVIAEALSDIFYLSTPAMLFFLIR